MIDIFDEWLSRDFGLEFNPFRPEYYDAGMDPRITEYLVGPDWLLGSIIHDLPSFIFAPVGGGKTAFRVRLARACRVGEYNRRILPVVYPLPWPTHLAQISEGSEPYLRSLNRQIAFELLLGLAYKPNFYLQLAPQTRRTICASLLANFPGDITFQLRQLDHEGKLDPLIKLYDPTAYNLIGTHSLSEPLKEFCRAIRRDISQTVSFEDQSQTERFDNLVALIKSDLGYEAIYILLDGADSYVESTLLSQERIGHLLVPLLKQTATLSDRNIYLKYFLPEDFLQTLPFFDLLAVAEMIDMNWMRVNWTSELLDQMLSDRLKHASAGSIGSLDELCTHELRPIHKSIIDNTDRRPREVLTLANRILFEYFRRTSEEPSELEEIDFEIAIDWYKGGGR